MRLADDGAVDYVGLAKGEAVINLTLVDDCSWNDPARHLDLLQRKINRYMDFIEGGEAHRTIAQQTKVAIDPAIPVRIVILAQFDLPAIGRDFILRATSLLGQHGVALTFKVL